MPRSLGESVIAGTAITVALACGGAAPATAASAAWATQVTGQAKASSNWVWRYAWNPTTTYTKNSVVSYNGSAWLAKKKSKGVAPSVNRDGWALVVTDGGPGATGPAGPVGATGPQGTRGVTGGHGPTGAAGSVGAAGPAGPQGPAGIQGPTGPSGATGNTGAAGATGPSGATGATGARGTIGEPGERGPSGPSGAPGVTGPSGPTGVTGPSGPTGVTGSFSYGPIGPTGTAVAFQENVIFTGATFAKGLVGYDPNTGVVTLNTTGVYTINFGVSTDGLLTQTPPLNVGFGVMTSQGDLCEAYSMVPVGIVGRTCIIEVAVAPVTLSLLNFGFNTVNLPNGLKRNAWLSAQDATATQIIQLDRTNP